MLNKMPVSTMAELSKSYISQVKSGKRPPSDKLIKALEQASHGNSDRKAHVENLIAIELFLKSRREGISPGTQGFYSKYLTKAIQVLSLTPSPRKIHMYFDSLTCSIGGKHAYFRAISVFYNWLYHPRSGFNFVNKTNPISLIDPPRRPKLILPSLSKEQVQLLISKAKSVRNKAIIALFTESGLRLSELTNLKYQDIDWKARTVKVLGKGNKEGYAPFGSLAEAYLREWVNEYQPSSNETIWDIGFWGIKEMLNDLEKETSLHCNPHTFGRTFACLLRKAGVDTMAIKDLGRWESLEMVQRYTRSVTFEDCMRHYKAPLS
jgi:site-specific recombinase XerD